MTPLTRWAKFNLVGVLGVGVQLAALALFNRLLRGHYVTASAIALELTLLHNFVWHLNFTWRDRRTTLAWRRQLARFHLTNGLVSLAGNLALTHVLVHRAHMPILAANALAILSCSAANFLLSHRWAFATARPTTPTAHPSLALCLVPMLLVFPCVAHAQQPSLPITPDAPIPHPLPRQPASPPPSTMSGLSTRAFSAGRAQAPHL